MSPTMSSISIDDISIDDSQPLFENQLGLWDYLERKKENLQLLSKTQLGSHSIIVPDSEPEREGKFIIISSWFVETHLLPAEAENQPIQDEKLQVPLKPDDPKADESKTESESECGSKTLKFIWRDIHLLIADKNRQYTDMMAVRTPVKKAMEQKKQSKTI